MSSHPHPNLQPGYPHHCAACPRSLTSASSALGCLHVVGNSGTLYHLSCLESHTETRRDDRLSKLQFSLPPLSFLERVLSAHNQHHHGRSDTSHARLEQPPQLCPSTIPNHRQSPQLPPAVLELGRNTNATAKANTRQESFPGPASVSARLALYVIRMEARHRRCEEAASHQAVSDMRRPVHRDPRQCEGHVPG